MTRYPSFYALQPRWLTTDRFYLVFVARDALCGAYIAGQIHDETSALVQLHQIYPVAKFWVKRVLARRAALEEKYRAMDPLSGEFLTADKRNFSILATQIVSLTVSRKPSVWAMSTVGKLKIVSATGETWRFVLTAQQNPNAIAKALKQFFPETEIAA